MKSALMTEMGLFDDYNYPPMNRRDLMANKPLNSSDFRMRKFKQIDTSRNHSFNNYALDIEGACPRRYGFYSLKPDYTNNCDDIEHSKPNPLFKYLNKPDYSLTNQDIDRSSPKKMSNFSTSRHVNPLCPDYPLPTVTPSGFPPSVPKFLRDNINISDIEGSHPRQRHHKFTRDNMLALSSDDTKMRKQIHKRGIYDNIDYSDVSKKNLLWSRNVNPLDPVYEVKYNGEEHYVHGEIEGSKPSPFSKFRIKSSNLFTGDIEGAQASTLNRYGSQWKDKHDGKEFNHFLTEIKGSKSSTHKKGIITRRCLNPLEPDYQFLDRNEKSNNVNERYQFEDKKRHFIEAKANDRGVVFEQNECVKTSQLPYQSNREKELIESFTQTETHPLTVQETTSKDYELNQFILSLNAEKMPKEKPLFNKDNYIIKGAYYPIRHDKSLIPIPSSTSLQPPRIFHPMTQSNSVFAKRDSIPTMQPYEHQLDSFLKEKHSYY